MLTICQLSQPIGRILNLCIYVPRLKLMFECLNKKKGSFGLHMVPRKICSRASAVAGRVAAARKALIVPVLAAFGVAVRFNHTRAAGVLYSIC